MSTPLLATSPTVQLEVNSERELEASVVLAAPNVNNALRINPEGLYVKRGVRRDAWQIARYPVTAALSTALATDQVLTWPTEPLDPDGLVDLAVQPTRVTVSEAGYYWSRAMCTLTGVGGTTAASEWCAQMYQRKNGNTWLGGQDVISNNIALTANQAVASCPVYAYLEAGDYLEVIWRWFSFTLLTQTSFTWIGAWAGMRIAP